MKKKCAIYVARVEVVFRDMFNVYYGTRGRDGVSKFFLVVFFLSFFVLRFSCFIFFLHRGSYRRNCFCVEVVRVGAVCVRLSMQLF